MNIDELHNKLAENHWLIEDLTEVDFFLIADVKEIIEKELLIDFCKSLELKAKEYNYLIPDENYIDEYLIDN